ncbi:uncharacterized protein LOC134336968 isoform X5 [Mobula hypostoma]|uniref:uncharacterized protein LOC134336968 isoform X5 n=1 Tax=Mobula hypostoma TaxID=723540 RepID=UPI002FC38292
MSSTSLPPLRNLPQWSHVGTLDRTRYPCSFSQNNIHPIPLSPALKTSKPEAPQQPSHVNEHCEVDPNLRATTLERNLKFLQEQHSETLEKLHKEIELLKQANQDLIFRMIMNQELIDQDLKPGESVEMKHGTLKLHLNKMLGTLSCAGQTTSLTDAAQMICRDHSTGKKHSQKGAQRRPVLPEDGVREQKVAQKELQKPSSTRRKLSTDTAAMRLLLRALLGLQRCRSALLLSDTCTTPAACSLRRHEATVTKADRVILPALKQTVGTQAAERQRRLRAVRKSHYRKVLL